MKKFFALTILSLFAVTGASAECPSVETLQEETVRLAVKAKRGEEFSKDSLKQIISCTEPLQNSDNNVVSQILVVATGLVEKVQGAY